MTKKAFFALGIALVLLTSCHIFEDSNSVSTSLSNSGSGSPGSVTIPPSISTSTSSGGTSTGISTSTSGSSVSTSTSTSVSISTSVSTTPSVGVSTTPSVSVSSSTSGSSSGTSTSISTKPSVSVDIGDGEEGWIYDNKDNYYNLNALANISGSELKTKLFNQVASHTTISYKGGLNEAYRTTDLRADGTVWDMYGDFMFSLDGNACGNYSKEGDCWNKEHSMPKSWFNDASPMYSDIYHLFPTDGKVNGMRGNLPFGEVGNANYTFVSKNASKTGLTVTNKRGTSNFPGYSGTVFEPDDMYKGDFARAYFYMVTAYEDRVSSWQSSNTNLGGTKYPGLNSWSTEMLLKWSIEDPISQKEIDRTNAAYKIQKNRNPYIDNHALACRVFGPYNENTKNMCRSVLEDTKVESVSIEEDIVELKTNETYQFEAKIMPQNATNKSVTWESSNPSVGTIDANGEFSAHAVGETIVTVKTNDGNYQDSCLVRVEYAPVIGVTGVSFVKNEVTLNINQKEKLQVSVFPENATNKKCTFTSSNENIVTVNALGEMTAKARGEANITVTTVDGGFQAQCKVNVIKPENVSTTIDKTIIANSVVDNYEYTLVGSTNKLVGENVYIAKGNALYNVTSFGSISKIEIYYGTGGSSAAKQEFSFGTSPLTTKPQTIEQTLTTSTGGTVGTIIPSNPNYGYFRMDVSEKNLQFSKIIIYF